MTALGYRSLVLPVALFAVAVAASGCGKNAAPSAPTSTNDSQGLSQQAADDIARQFAATISRRGLPLGRVGDTSFQAIARGQAPAAALRSNGAASLLDEGGFSWSFSITFFDEARNQQPGYDPETTARMRVHARARGFLTTPEHRATIGSERLLDVAGLLPAETVLEIDGAANDTADAAFDSRDGSTSRRYHLLAEGALTDVKQLKDESVNPYPLSGTAKWEAVVDASSRDSTGISEFHYEVTVLVTFNGTRHPTIEISERYRYQMDLETGEITPLPA